MKAEEENGKYDDIVSLPHHVSKRHPQMPLLDRAAQFAPFAALTGALPSMEYIPSIDGEEFEEMNESDT